MRILLVPNALKGSLRAADFVKIATRTLGKKHRVSSLCLSDGGDGFLDFFKALYPQAQTKYCVAKNAFVKNKRVPFLLLPDGKTAVLETAKICGLGNLSKKELDILNASSYGVGQVLLKAVALGADTVYIGLGGVACSDGGAGLAAACGALLTDKSGQALCLGAQPLLQLNTLDTAKLTKRFKAVHLIGVSDVNNPLLGPKSSAKVFGPQKGATPAQVKLLDKAMAVWARAIQQATGRTIAHQPSTAAAGAIGAGLAGCFGAQLMLGTQFLLKKTSLEKQIQKADLIITAEGKLDAQTFYGKAPFAVLKLAKKYKKPVLFICGQLDAKCLKNNPLAPDQIAVLADFAPNLTEAKTHAAKYIRRVLKNL